jgi:cell division protein FtsX
MDRQMILDHLTQAEGHVALGEERITRQREILANLTRDGHREAASRAAELLAQFEQTQTLHISDRDRLRRELAENLG